MKQPISQGALELLFEVAARPVDRYLHESPARRELKRLALIRSYRTHKTPSHLSKWGLTAKGHELVTQLQAAAQ